MSGYRQGRLPEHKDLDYARGCFGRKISWARLTIPVLVHPTVILTKNHLKTMEEKSSAPSSRCLRRQDRRAPPVRIDALWPHRIHCPGPPPREDGGPSGTQAPSTNDKRIGAVGQQPFEGPGAGTNDSEAVNSCAGSAGTIKTFNPPVDYRYPHMLMVV